MKNIYLGTIFSYSHKINKPRNFRLNVKGQRQYYLKICNHLNEYSKKIIIN